MIEARGLARRAFGLGMILRHTAGAISASTALLLVVPLLVTFLPQSWPNDVDRVRSARDVRSDRADRRDGGLPQARCVRPGPVQCSG
jgi:hypothetical protein